MTPDRSDSRLGFLETDLAQVLDASPLSLLVLQGGRLVFANARALRSLALTLESAIGSDPSLAIIDEGARERARDRSRRAEAGEPQPPIVYQTLRADGKRVWARVESTPCVFGGKAASLLIAQDATDEVEASLSLRESEERYRRLFEDSPLGIAISRDGTLLLANPALARLAGAPSTEALAGFSLLKFAEPAVRDATLMRLMNVQGGSDVPQISRRLRNLQGREIQIDVISKPFVHEGKPAVLTLVIDATARNVAELKAQQSEDKYRHLLESSPNALVVTRDRKILLSNSMFARFTGVPSPDALTGRHLIDFAPPEDRAETEARLKAVDLGERAPWIEAEVLKADGTLYPVEAQSEPFEYEGAHAILTIMRDISDRKAMEATRRQVGAAARETEDRYRALVDGLPDGVTLHTGRTLMFANESMARLLGVSHAQELVGRDPLEFVGPEELQSILELLTRVEAGELMPTRQFNLRRTDGARIQVEVVSRQVKFGDKPAVQSLIRDVTERKRAERSQAAIYRIADASARAESLFELLEAVHSAVGDLMDARNFFIALKDASGENFTFPYLRDELFPVLTPVPIANTLSGYVLGRGAPLLLNQGDMNALHEDGVPVYGPKAVSWIGVPLIARDSSFGVLVVQSYREEVRYSDADRDLLSYVSRHIAEAIERQRKEDQIEHLAFHDGLTGLPNRLLFEDRLTNAVAQSERRQAPLSILFVDLDRFKVINDSLGHPIGDEVLKIAGARLSESLRDGDSLARRGGDEFLVLLPDTPPTGAAQVAQKLIECIRAPMQCGGHDLTISASCGIAVFPENGNDAESLLKAADIAMYRAKESGRDAYRLFNPEMNAAAQRRLTVETTLRRSIATREIGPHFQPIVNAATGAIVAAEALLRWSPFLAGTMPPKEFIPVAEQSGLIVSLGAFVMREALAHAREWPTSQGTLMRVSINLAARQVQDPLCVELILELLRDASFPPGRLQLELSESTQLTEDVAAVDRLRALKAAGISIAIDDFGVGYSSLSRLRDLPFDTLKIDGSFIKDISTDEGSGAVAGAVISLGHHLGLEVIAEGVETEAQKKHLLARGCSLMQGYHFAAAMPSAVFAAWVRQRDRDGV